MEGGASVTFGCWTLHALSDHLTFLRFLMPELITEKVIAEAFDALARGNRN